MPVRTASSADTVLAIPPIDVRVVRLRLVGDSPLICHRWAEKAKREIADKQQGKAMPAKAPKDPDADYRDSLYPLPDPQPGGPQYGFPSVAFKTAAVDAATQLSGMTKTYLRGAFHAVGELVPIEGAPRMREDMTRVGMGVADIRYRGEFPTWAAEVELRYNAGSITLQRLVHLFNHAGFAVGVGEWRPQRDGQYGMFHVEGLTDLGTWDVPDVARAADLRDRAGGVQVEPNGHDEATPSAPRRRVVARGVRG